MRTENQLPLKHLLNTNCLHGYSIPVQDDDDYYSDDNPGVHKAIGPEMAQWLEDHIEELTRSEPRHGCIARKEHKDLLANMSMAI